MQCRYPDDLSSGATATTNATTTNAAASNTGLLVGGLRRYQDLTIWCLAIFGMCMRA